MSIVTPYTYRQTLSLDVDEHATGLSGWRQTYDQISSGAFLGQVIDIWFAGLQISRETTNRVISQRGTPWEGAYVIGLSFATREGGSFEQQGFHRNALATFHSEHEFTVTTQEQSDSALLAIPEATLRNVLELEFPGGKLPLAQSPALLVGQPEHVAALKRELMPLFDRERFDASTLAYPQVQKTLHSSIMGALTDLLCSASRAPLPSRSFKGRRMLVREAVDYALASKGEPVTVAELCAQFHISRRMLNYCFEEVLSISPLQYLRALRLNAVRRELRSAQADRSIQDIACQWGFWHLSRFSAEYRELFGELPSATRRRHVPTTA